MNISKKGIELIKRFEGCRLEAYKDIVGVWTIGFGFTKGVKAGDRMTMEECERRLTDELREYEAGVLLATGSKVTQNQFDALVSFAWNVGIEGMKKSSVIRFHNAGNYIKAKESFALWNKAGGKVVQGLVNRRAAEAELYGS
jgi:lysozyme